MVYLAIADDSRHVGAPVGTAKRKGQESEVGVELVRGLEANDQGQPRVVQEVSQGVALREHAAAYAREQRRR